MKMSAFFPVENFLFVWVPYGDENACVWMMSTGEALPVPACVDYPRLGDSFFLSFKTGHGGAMWNAENLFRGVTAQF